MGTRIRASSRPSKYSSKAVNMSGVLLAPVGPVSRLFKLWEVRSRIWWFRVAGRGRSSRFILTALLSRRASSSVLEMTTLLVSSKGAETEPCACSGIFREQNSCPEWQEWEDGSNRLDRGKIWSDSDSEPVQDPEAETSLGLLSCDDTHSDFGSMLVLGSGA